MEDKKDTKIFKDIDPYKMIVAILSVVLGVVGVSTHLTQLGPISLGFIISVVSVFVAVIVFVKKLDGKAFAMIGLLLGIIGVVLGGVVSVTSINAYLDDKPLEYARDCKGKPASECREINFDSDRDSSALDKQAEELYVCLDEKGIDRDIYYDDLADSEKDAYDECLRSLFN